MRCYDFMSWNLSRHTPAHFSMFTVLCLLFIIFSNLAFKLLRIHVVSVGQWIFFKSADEYVIYSNQIPI